MRAFRFWDFSGKYSVVWNGRDDAGCSVGAG
jgi:hypothetical protein